MKKFLSVMSIIFSLLALYFYFNSDIRIGTESVINIQATIFSAACAVLCGINYVGYLVLSRHETLASEIQRIKKELTLEIRHNLLDHPISDEDVNSQTSEEYDPNSYNASTSDDLYWIDDNPGYVRCPRCNDRMSIDFIQHRKQCRRCGFPYTEKNES